MAELGQGGSSSHSIEYIKILARPDAAGKGRFPTQRTQRKVLAMATANPCYRRGLAVASGGVGAGPQRCIMGSQSVLVVRWSVVRSELALNYTQGPWLRFLRCVRLKTGNVTGEWRGLAAGPGVSWLHAEWPLAAVAASWKDATSANLSQGSIRYGTGTKSDKRRGDCSVEQCEKCLNKISCKLSLVCWSWPFTGYNRIANS